ncbi:protein ECERIFERUM 26-like [Durio zibethinus]|uniref:Protein ECERIFERUM 26-like n=1 Tax=Durio zibethinus TaxID=66656 RepID=A0A6P6A7Z4_DURZI|nr:protein ECERIFERUM 26-like [Durio zibethinus]
MSKSTNVSKSFHKILAHFFPFMISYSATFNHQSMVLPEQEHLVYNIRLSSVGPGRVTGSDVVHDLSGLDIAMKLHYLKGVYFFTDQAVEGLTIRQMKETMFYWLNDYYITCGRIRRTESGRPYIKCNDCGIRFVEGVCDKTIDEWLELGDDSLHNLLVYHRAIGPELSFSPSVYLQVTRFKCGGISLGMSWAHILGDAFSASEFINNWGRYMARLKSNGPLTLPKSLDNKIEKPHDPNQFVKEPLSAKQVNPVGDLWIAANNCKMETFSFYLSTLHLSSLQEKILGEDGRKRISPFSSVCAVIWQCIAKVREGFEPQIVTVCRKYPNYDNNVLSNSQIISAIKADFSVMEADLKKLALLMADDQGLDERNKIEAAVEKDDGVTDYIMYGTNLTFVNLEDANLYELELKGQKPKFAYYSIQGVGDEGAVLFLPGPPKGSNTENEGKLVTITLPEDQVLKLKTELQRTGLLPTELE